MDDNKIGMVTLLGAFYNSVSQGVDKFEADAEGFWAYVAGAVDLVDAVAEIKTEEETERRAAFEKWVSAETDKEACEKWADAARTEAEA